MIPAELRTRVSGLGVSTQPAYARSGELPPVRRTGWPHQRRAVRDRAAAPRQAAPGDGSRDPAASDCVLRKDAAEFGYRFIADELEQQGHRSCERRVWRICRPQRVWSTTTRKGRKSSGKTPGPAVHDDLVQRDFSAPAPDVVWLTDITEHATAEGKLYCCSIEDVFSNRIVGYSISDHMTAALAVSALRSAIARRQPNGTVVGHSDRRRVRQRRRRLKRLHRGVVTGGRDPAHRAGEPVRLERGPERSRPELAAPRSATRSLLDRTHLQPPASSASARPGSPPSSSSSPSPRRPPSDDEQAA